MNRTSRAWSCTPLGGGAFALPLPSLLWNCRGVSDRRGADPKTLATDGEPLASGDAYVAATSDAMGGIDTAALPHREAPTTRGTDPVDAADAVAFACSVRMQDARAELLRAGFNPAQDTPQWLKVTGPLDGGVSLKVYTVYTPDGDGYRTYEADLRPSRGASRDVWRLVQRSVLDEFKEERLPERTWTRARAGWVARIHTRTEQRNLVDIFEPIVRKALDDCLAHPGEVGRMERCDYVLEENRWSWSCAQW